MNNFAVFAVLAVFISAGVDCDRVCNRWVQRLSENQSRKGYQNQQTVQRSYDARDSYDRQYDRQYDEFFRRQRNQFDSFVDSLQSRNSGVKGVKQTSFEPQYDTSASVNSLQQESQSSYSESLQSRTSGVKQTQFEPSYDSTANYDRLRQQHEESLRQRNRFDSIDASLQSRNSETQIKQTQFEPSYDSTSNYNRLRQEHEESLRHRNRLGSAYGTLQSRDSGVKGGQTQIASDFGQERIGEGGGKSYYYSVDSSAYAVSSDINGVRNHKEGGTTTVNDNGRVATYTI